MKRNIILLMICLVAVKTNNISGGVPATELKLAGDHGLVSFTINGNEKSPHYIRPLQLTIKNLKKEVVTIHISNGLQFIAKDSSYQNFIATKDELIALRPGEEKKIELYGMCTEPKDMAPNKSSIYTVSSKTNTKLNQVTALIEQYKCFESTGQYAIWAMTGNYPLDLIAGFDTAQASRLQKLVSKLTGKPLPPPPAANDFKRNYYCRQVYTSRIGGKFDWELYRSMEVRIAMFDTNNMLVRELYSNPKEEPGYHSYRFVFDGSAYRDPVYFIKLLINGNITGSVKI